MENTVFSSLASRLRQSPDALARISGSEKHPNIHGRVSFYQTNRGVLVAAEISGLPKASGDCGCRVFGFHIHGGRTCSGNEKDPFADALNHYNPGDCLHPCHAGDMPPLFENRGYAFLVFLSDRFTVREITGRTVIIHSMPDDFSSQPGGGAGDKIACGKIEAWHGPRHGK